MHRGTKACIVASSHRMLHVACSMLYCCMSHCMLHCCIVACCMLHVVLLHVTLHVVMLHVACFMLHRCMSHCMLHCCIVASLQAALHAALLHVACYCMSHCMLYVARCTSYCCTVALLHCMLYCCNTCCRRTSGGTPCLRREAESRCRCGAPVRRSLGADLAGHKQSAMATARGRGNEARTGKRGAPPTRPCARRT
jgi:hypothetical protein